MDHGPAHPEHPVDPDSVKQTVRRLYDSVRSLWVEVRDEIVHTGSLMCREPTGKGVRRPPRLHPVDRRRRHRPVEHGGTRDYLGLLERLRLLPIREKR